MSRVIFLPASTVKGKDYYQQHLDATGVLHKLRNALEMLRDVLKNALPHLKLEAAQWLHTHGEEADKQQAIKFYRDTLQSPTTEANQKLNVGQALLGIDRRAHRASVIPVFESLAQRGDGFSVGALMEDTPETQERTRAILRNTFKNDSQNKDCIAETLYLHGTEQDKNAVVTSYLAVVEYSQ